MPTETPESPQMTTVQGFTLHIDKFVDDKPVNYTIWPKTSGLFRPEIKIDQDDTTILTIDLCMLWDLLVNILAKGITSQNPMVRTKINSAMIVLNSYKKDSQ